ncbi:hypothetical protein QBC42DRAFT_166137, partial [Cladorrhinum samala]
KAANLDFEARVPVPFSVFPSAYRESATATQTHVHEQVKIQVPPAGQELAVVKPAVVKPPPAPQTLLPPPPPVEVVKEEVRIVREDKPEKHHHHHHLLPAKVEKKVEKSSYTESRIEIDSRHRPHTTALDVAESDYRSRIQSNYRSETSTTVDAPTHRPTSVKKAHSHVGDLTVGFPIKHSPAKKTHSHADDFAVVPARTVIRKDIKIVEDPVESRASYSSTTVSTSSKAKMGYYDEDGHYHSYRQALSHKVHENVHKIANSIAHPEAHSGAEVARSTSESKPSANTVTIPCHHIRLGDILILQGRPCQVIRISTSAATGQHRYLGVDLFTKQLHEESSFISNPAPSVVVQTMLGPVFKQYRVLDMQDGSIVAMTESGDVKPNLSVIDQSNLWTRLQKAFESGRGSVRVLVVTDNGREMAVDMKVVHGSRL